MQRQNRPYVSVEDRQEINYVLRKLLNRKKIAAETYWDVSAALAVNPTYIVAFGKRSNGKTSGAVVQGLKDYVDGLGAMAIVRRWKDDFNDGFGLDMFGSEYLRSQIVSLTNGAWDTVSYRQKRWYLARYDKQSDSLVSAKEPFAYAFDLSTYERKKSRQYPPIKNIIFDEFLTSGRYLPNEIQAFMNVISSIVRLECKARIWMLGNTVDFTSMYFRMMGVNIKNMSPGDFYLYEITNAELEKFGIKGKMVVQYTDGVVKNKPINSDVYFTAFDDPSVRMITAGEWETEEYPKLPTRFIGKKPKIVFEYYIEFEFECLKCEIQKVDNVYFTFVHQHTGKIPRREKQFIFTSKDFSPNPRHMRYLNRGCGCDSLQSKLNSFFRNNMVFFSDNMAGQTMHNYLEWCRTDKVV